MTSVAALAALGLEGRVLVVLESFDTAVARSFRNLPAVQLIKATELNAYDILCNDWIVFSQSNLPQSDPSRDDPAPPDTSTDDPSPPDASADDPSPPRDDRESVTASAPDRSDDDTTTGG